MNKMMECKGFFWEVMLQTTNGAHSLRWFCWGDVVRLVTSKGNTQKVFKEISKKVPLKIARYVHVKCSIASKSFHCDE